MILTFRRLAYYTAALSGIFSSLWIPDSDTHGWVAPLCTLWAIACWLIFVWNEPRDRNEWTHEVARGRS